MQQSERARLKRMALHVSCAGVDGDMGTAGELGQDGHTGGVGGMPPIQGVCCPVTGDMS